jgi:hypothetical protein
VEGIKINIQNVILGLGPRIQTTLTPRLDSSFHGRTGMTDVIREKRA